MLQKLTKRGGELTKTVIAEAKSRLYDDDLKDSDEEECNNERNEARHIVKARTNQSTIEAPEEQPTQRDEGK
jgi:hypothetical protein